MKTMNKTILLECKNIGNIGMGIGLYKMQWTN